MSAQVVAPASEAPVFANVIDGLSIEASRHLPLVADVDHGMPLVDDEQFGPVLPIIRYADVEEAIAKANDNPNGLGGSIWSSDADKARGLARRPECGTAWVNKHGAIQPNAPFGGIKQSGFGVEFGQEGLHQNTNVQTVMS